MVSHGGEMNPLISHVYNHFLGKRSKKIAKSSYYKTLKMLSKSVFSYDPEDLCNALQKVGVSSGDTIMVHSSFTNFNGFQGKPQDIITCFKNVVGDQGNILMVSMPYGTSSLHYLQEDPVFDVKRTMSRMGLLTEIFRRTEGVVRSLSPTHPVLAYGKDASWIVQDHEKCPYPCGEGSPFNKLYTLKGKVLFFDVPFTRFTFFHYIEDLIQERLPFPMYSAEPVLARVKDYQGNTSHVPVYVFPEHVFNRRQTGMLGEVMEKRKLLNKKRIGNTSLMLLSSEDAVQCTVDMLDDGLTLYKES